MYVVKRAKRVKLSKEEVAQIVGLSVSHIMRLEREGKFPKRIGTVGRPRWSKLQVYHWLNRWGIRSERKRK